MYCMVLHIGIYLSWTNNKKTQKSFVSFQHGKHDRTFYLIWFISESNFYVLDFCIKVTLKGELFINPG